MSTEKLETLAIKKSYLPLICGAVSLLVYLGTLQFQFVYDDRGQIVDNPAIRSWRFLPQYFNRHVWEGILSSSAYYRPLDLVWFRFNHWLFGLSASGWHLTSILVHCLATVSVFYLIARLLRDVRIAALSALIFGLHPIHAQSAAWISAIPDPLLTIFICGSLISYLNFRESRGGPWLYWSLFLYACAILTKETGIILPALILAEKWRESGNSLNRRPSLNGIRDAAMAVLPFLAVTLAYIAARIHALKEFSPFQPYISVTQMVLTWPAVLWLYTKHLFLPWGYSLYYDLPPVQHVLNREFLVPSGLLALAGAIIVAVALGLKLKRDLVVTAMVWLVLPLMPSLYLRGLEPPMFGQDRYLYLSCIGFAIFVSAVVVAVSDLEILRSRSRSIQLYATAVLAMTLASCTLVQQQYWVSNLALFRRAVSIAPNNTHALNNLAVTLAEDHQLEPAIIFFERGLQLDPYSAHLSYNYGHSLYQVGDYKDALRLFSKAIQFDPSIGEAYLYMGLSHLKLGYPEDAGFEIRHAIALEPERRGAHLAMGAVLEAEGDLPGALAETRIEANNFPDDPLIHRRLIALEQQTKSKQS